MAREIGGSQYLSDANLKGYWKLEDVNDSGPNGYTLTNNNTCTFSAGKFNNAVNVASTGSKYLSRSNASGISNIIISGAQTFLAWVYSSSTPEGSVMSVNTNGTSGVDMFISAGVPYFRGSGLTTNTEVQSSVTMTSGNWYMVGGIYDSANSKLKIWVNLTKTEVTSSGSVTSVAPNFNIGAIGNGTNIFTGQIDDVAIFDRALTDAEITDIYSNSNFIPKFINFN